MVLGLLVILPRLMNQSSATDRPNFAAPALAPVSPLLSGPEALHIRATQVYLTAEGLELERLPLEFWHLPNGNARLELKDIAGTAVTVLKRNGDTYSQFDGTDNTTITQTESTDSPVELIKPVEEMFKYKTLLDEGELQPIGEDVVDGKQATVLGDLYAGTSGAFKAYIDKANYLDLKVVGTEYTTSSGDPVSDGTVRTEYTLIERLDPALVPASLFEIRVTIQSVWEEGEPPVPTADPDLTP